MCVSKMTTTTAKDGGVSASKYAVIRLKNSDNILGLFQLLLHNGYSQVSFVNSLNETIFPLNDRIDKGTQTIVPMPPPPLQLPNSSVANFNACFSAHLNGGGRNNSIGNNDIGRLAAAVNNNRSPLSPFDRKPQLSAATAAALSALDLLPPGLSHHFGQSLASLPNIPSGFLGLPTLPSLLVPHTGVGSINNSHGIFSVASNLLAAAESTTPPYAVLNNSGHHHNNNQHHHQHHHHSHRASSKQQHSSSNGQLNVLPTKHQQLSQQHLTDISPPPSMVVAQQPITENSRPRSSSQQLSESVSVAAVKRQSQDIGQNNNHNNNSWQNATNDPISQMILQTVPTATNTQLRQRGQRSYNDDPSLYVTCRLCKNRIMGSRISNLTNHVRRHSTLKQFQCCYCDYTHNEMAKVRLHMLHNHKDKDSQPIDNLSPEMQVAWEQLMKECFPNHCQQTQQLQQQQQLSQQQLQQTTFLDGDDEECARGNGAINSNGSSTGVHSWKLEDPEDDDVIMSVNTGSTECDENGESESGAIIYDGGSSSVESAGSDGGKEKDGVTDDSLDGVVDDRDSVPPLNAPASAPLECTVNTARIYTPKYRKRFKIM